MAKFFTAFCKAIHVFCVHSVSGIFFITECRELVFFWKKITRRVCFTLFFVGCFHCNYCVGTFCRIMTAE